MDYLLGLFTRTDIGMATSLLRLGLAALASLIIGAERELRRQPAGLRTHILIGTGACLLMLLSIWLPAALGVPNGDPGRIAAQVVSGIGFLGAGAILRFGTDVKGITTSASIWATSAIGLSLGAGLYLPAGIAFLIVILTLSALEKVERRVFNDTLRLKALELYFDRTDSDTSIAEEILKRRGVVVRSVNMDLEIQKDRMKLSFVVEIPKDIDLKALMKELKAIGKLERICIGERL
jgi:putative Mg2+ transporter-C (MgtC) family protein